MVLINMQTVGIPVSEPFGGPGAAELEIIDHSGDCIKRDEPHAPRYYRWLTESR